MSDHAFPTITAKELHELLSERGEYALVDVREAGVTAERGSILLAVSIPLSVLELRVDALVPRRSTRVVVYDGGSSDDRLAERAAVRLGQLGYSDVAVLDGGLVAWAEEGHKVQTGGDHVIGQAFGEWIEEVYSTPHITVADYRAAVAAGQDVVLLDSRPLPEFAQHSLPGGTSLPGAELVYRAGEVVTSPDSLVVVNCAGRTRSILGAQVLINAGLSNRVVSLEGGTQSWVLEGHELDHGKQVSAPRPTGTALAAAAAAAERIADRFGVRTVDAAELARFREDPDRSLYLLDVRTPEEFAQSHLAGARSAPSWDVAPWVFRHVGTHHARIVLVDDDQVRATVAASWIVQFGWGEVFVLRDGLAAGPLERGPVAARVLGLPESRPASIGPDRLRTELDGPDAPQVVDLQPSPGFRAGHVPGAVFAIRSRLAASADAVPGTGAIVLTSEDGVLARLAAAELAAATDRPVRVLAGGTAAWRARGFPLAQGAEPALHPADDVVASGWRETDPQRQKAAFRRYLSWELGLVAELREDDTVPFTSFA